VNIDLMAHRLALRHVQRYVDSNYSEHQAALTWGASGRGHKHWQDAPDGFGGYEVSIGGWYDYDSKTGLARKRVQNNKVLVTEVCGVEGLWIFSLHGLYQECKKGQLALNIAYQGPLLDYSGYGEANRHFVAALRAAGITVTGKLLNYSKERADYGS
jgi:hypothetical protein